MDRGYKPHTVWSSRATPEVWDLTSLKVGEVTVAGEMIRRLSAGRKQL
jgi:hypothetical protein